MAQLVKVVQATQAELVLSSSWRKFDHTRALLAKELAKHGLRFRNMTTIAGGETAEGRVDQVLAYVHQAKVQTWAVVDDEDLQALPNPNHSP